MEQRLCVCGWTNRGECSTIRRCSLNQVRKQVWRELLSTTGAPAAQAAVEAYASPAAERVYVGKRGQRESIKQPAIDAILLQHTLAVRLGRSMAGGAGGRGGCRKLWRALPCHCGLAG